MSTPAHSPAAGSVPERTFISQRLPEMMSLNRDHLNHLIDQSIVGHLSYVHHGRAHMMASAFVRVGDTLLTHGSTGSRWLRDIADGREVVLSFAAIDGVVVARSAFESSFLYRSAILVGSFSPVPDDRKVELLDSITEHFIPGRTAEVRPHLKKELAATLILEMPITQWSLRISDGWPEDEDFDIASDTWGGVVAYGTAPAQAYPAPDLREGIPVPATVQHMVQQRPTPPPAPDPDTYQLDFATH